MNQLNYNTRFKNLIGRWKEEYQAATSKKLTNSEFAGILRMSREHFQRLIKEDSSIDVAQYENLLARYIVWHFATKFGVDSKQALSSIEVEGFLDYIDESIYNTIWGAMGKAVNSTGADVKEKSGTSQAPDHLLTLVNDEINTMYSSLQRLAKGLLLPADPGTNVPGSEGFARVSEDKKEKSGKP